MNALYWMRRTGDGEQLVADANGRLILVLVDGLLAPLAQSSFHGSVEPGATVKRGRNTMFDC